MRTSVIISKEIFGFLNLCDNLCDICYSQVTLTVTRNFGQSGQVRVRYATSPNTAEEYTDYEPSSGWLTFSNNQRQQALSMQITNDMMAEAPETFYVNLTEIRLEFPT